MTENLQVNVSLRPIRFAFIARPNDKAAMQKIFEVNTCLWGGRFNPIIPYLELVPRWWDRNSHKLDNAKQIMNGYLDYFEPDFLVETEKGLADNLGFDKERVLDISKLLPFDQSGNDSTGCSVFDIYEDLYKREFQFVKKYPPKVAHIVTDDKQYQLFASALFGSFPNSRKLKYFTNVFSSVFNPEKISLSGDNILDIYEKNYVTALRIGQDQIEADYNGYTDLTFFVMDVKQPRDLMDFWNLRAVHKQIIAIPLNWISELSPFIKSVVTKNYRPLPRNKHGVMIRSNAIFSRSIKKDKIEQLFKKYIAIDEAGAVSLQEWYPPLWKPSPRWSMRETRPILTVKDQKTNAALNLDDPEIRFPTLTPDFGDKYGAEYRWANVIKLGSWVQKTHIATVFPTDYKKGDFPTFDTVSDHVLSTTEGLVTFPLYRDSTAYWKIPSGTEAFKTWFKKHGLIMTLSESGRATTQIIQTLGGFWGVSSIANKETIELLNSISRKPVTRSMQYQEFKSRINQANKNRPFSGKSFEVLVDKNAVELGQEIKCDKCSSWTWYGIDKLSYKLTCQNCLRDILFPVKEPAHPDKAKFSYRVIGPFALPKYADGGYAGALAIRFFASVIGKMERAQSTWAAGCLLSDENGKKLEADFAIWYQNKRMFGLNEPTDLIFGETKSFGKDRFGDEDIIRLKTLAERFPGSILVFATMRTIDELSKKEKQMIKKLALWGREYDREKRQSRAPVVLLTGTELFSDYLLTETWKEMGGKHKALVETMFYDLDDPKFLADATQQIYLGIKPYNVWLRERMRARSLNRRGSNTA